MSCRGRRQGLGNFNYFSKSSWFRRRSSPVVHPISYKRFDDWFRDNGRALDSCDTVAGTAWMRALQASTPRYPQRLSSQLIPLRLVIRRTRKHSSSPSSSRYRSRKTGRRKTVGLLFLTRSICAQLVGWVQRTRTIRHEPRGPRRRDSYCSSSKQTATQESSRRHRSGACIVALPRCPL